MKDLLEQYEKTFGEPFPMMLVLGMDEDEIADAIEDCLVYGRRFEPDVPRDVLI